MLRIATSERRIDASPQRVFRALVDAERYPCWLVGAKQVTIDDRRWPFPGSEFHHEVGAGPLDLQDSTSVAGFDPWRRFDLVVRSRPFLVADVHFDVEPEGSGTRIRMTERPRGVVALLGPLVAPLVRLRNDRSLARLAHRLAEPASPVGDAGPLAGVEPDAT